MNKKLCLIVFGLVLLVLSLAASSLAQPTNDNFFNAEVIDPTSLPLTYIVNNADATLQQDEPNYICQYSQKTVWYKITPTSDEVLLAKMEGSMIYDTVLRVFQQTGSDITSLASPTYCWTYCEECSDAWAPAATWVIFSVSAGTTYYIQVGNSYSDGGELHLTVEVYPPPPNDNFADATVIPGVPFTSDSLNLMAATEEIGEPIPSCFFGHPFGGTAWYKFTPSVTQYYVGNLMYPIWNWCFGVYTGSSLGKLSQLVSHDGNPVTFYAIAGTTYYIQVYNGGQWVGAVNFTLDSAPPPPAITVNDLIALVDSMNLRSSVTNSLLSYLNDANFQLGKAKPNVNGACSDLSDFISLVNAQTGKKITAEQASQLVAAAMQIKIQLSCK